MDLRVSQEPPDLSVLTRVIEKPPKCKLALETSPGIDVLGGRQHL